jgi:hypothetical protein
MATARERDVVERTERFLRSQQQHHQQQQYDSQQEEDADECEQSDDVFESALFPDQHQRHTKALDDAGTTLLT